MVKKWIWSAQGLLLVALLAGCGTMPPPAPPDLVRPFDVATAVTTARAYAAAHLEIPEERLVYSQLLFPLVSLLPENEDGLVIMLDLDAHEVLVEGEEEITLRTSVQVRIRPDGSPRWNGTSTGRASRPYRARRRLPPEPTPDPVTEVPDYDYIALALEAAYEHVPEEDREWLMPMSVRFEYRDLAADTPDLRYIFVHLFDPREIVLLPERGLETVTGHAVLFRPDGRVVYRGPSSFGASPRFSQIAAFLEERGNR